MATTSLKAKTLTFSRIKSNKIQKSEFFIARYFFFHRSLLSGTLTTHRTAGEGRGPFRHLFATLYVRWISHIFHHTACIYQTLWDLLPYRITISLIDDAMLIFVCLFTWWFDSKFLSQQFDMWNRKARTRIDYHPCITSEPTNI